jgi:hypothetical protein
MEASSARRLDVGTFGKIRRVWTELFASLRKFFAERCVFARLQSRA